jgi:hypothetical protein
MPGLHVPSKFRPALIQIANLSDDAVSELSSLLESNPDVLTSREAAHDNAGRLTKLSAEDGIAILDAVIPLLFFKASSGQSTETVVTEAIKALKSGDKQDEKIPPALVPKLEKRLARFLALSGVALKAKALSLATDCPRLYTDAKIITDIRPIFGAEVESIPLGATVVHSLRVTFGESGFEKEFFVQLDVEDLKELQELVDRAIKKDSTLKGFLQQNKLQIFETSISS